MKSRPHEGKDLTLSVNGWQIFSLIESSTGFTCCKFSEFFGIYYFGDKWDERFIGFGVDSFVYKNEMGIYLIRLFGISSFFRLFSFSLDKFT